MITGIGLLLFSAASFQRFNVRYFRPFVFFISFWLTVLVIFVVKTYIPDKGLAYKTSMEYLIIAMFVLTVLLLITRKTNAQTYDTEGLLIVSSILALSEMCFTFSSLNAADLDILGLGHLYRIIALVFMYRFVYTECLKKPYHELRHSQSIMKKNHEWLYTTLTSISDGVIAANEQGKVIIMNPTAEKITGWNSASALGKTARRRFSGFSA